MRGPDKKETRVYATAGGLAYGGPFCVVAEPFDFAQEKLRRRMDTRSETGMSGIVLFFNPRTRYAQAILLVALLASLAVAFFRVRVESHANRVELAMDFTDLDAVARSYDYNPSADRKSTRLNSSHSSISY